MCAAPRYFADLVTPIDRPLPLNAPLLVTVASARSGALEVQRGQTVITPPSLALVQGETRHPLQSESIGPGLFVYRAESPLEPGEYQLEGFAEARTLPLASIALPSLTVPAVQRVRHEEHVREGREGGRSWRDRIELAAPAPAEIVALLFTFADSTARIDIGAAGDRRVVE
jgi:hypothetical protein